MRRAAIIAFIAAAALPVLFGIVISIDSATGCPDVCGAFGSPLRLFATIGYYGMFMATPALFLIGVAALAVHAARR